MPVVIVNPSSVVPDSKSSVLRPLSAAKLEIKGLGIIDTNDIRGPIAIFERCPRSQSNCFPLIGLGSACLRPAS